MPNILSLKFQPSDGESGWRTLISWRVPVDDTQHVAFLVNRVDLSGAAADRYRANMEERRKVLAGLTPGHLAAAAVQQYKRSV